MEKPVNGRKASATKPNKERCHCSNPKYTYVRNEARTNYIRRHKLTELKSIPLWICQTCGGYTWSM